MYYGFWHLPMERVYVLYNPENRRHKVAAMNFSGYSLRYSPTARCFAPCQPGDVGTGRSINEAIQDNPWCYQKIGFYVR